MTIGGKIPFTGTFANFSTGRVYDQIRQSIAYSEKNVKICASHAGLTLGEDGATHQILEDIGMMKMLPNMTVIVPADYEQTRQATLAIAKHHGPVYLRFGRPKVPVFIQPEAPFEIGKIQRIITGSDVTIAACGHLVWEAVQAALELAKDGISAEVLNVHTVKPLDETTLVESAKRTGAVVVAEEHQRLGGLGSSVAQCLASHHPTKMDFVAVEDQFGESGTPAQLMAKYGLDAKTIVTKTRRCSVADSRNSHAEVTSRSAMALYNLSARSLIPSTKGRRTCASHMPKCFKATFTPTGLPSANSKSMMGVNA